MAVAAGAAAAEQASAGDLRRADRRAARLPRAVRVRGAERADRGARARPARRLLRDRHALAASSRGVARLSAPLLVDRSRVLRNASLVAALGGLHFALTFGHVWPTFAIRPTATVSI